MAKTNIHNILIVSDESGGSITAAETSSALEKAVRRHLVGGEKASVTHLSASAGGLEDRIAAADTIIIGMERFGGRSLDAQAVGNILRLCKNHRKKPTVVCEDCELPESLWKKTGIEDVFCLSEIEGCGSAAGTEGLSSGADILIAGCDEAGRGCLAGPVVAAAVILPEDFTHPFLNDSKQISEARRDTLRPIIEKEALAWAVTAVDAGEIDRINILNASIEGMKRSLDKLALKPDLVLVDGNRFTFWNNTPCHTVVKGDGRVRAIAAASVLAKTHRDEYMKKLAQEYPQYGWERNMAYPTEEHRRAIREHGLTPFHRRSYKLSDDAESVLF